MRFPVKSIAGVLPVLGVHLDTDAVSSPLGGGDVRRPRSRERVKDRIPHETEHPDESFRELEGERCRMMASGRAGQTGPDLFEPDLVLVSRDDGEDARAHGRTSVASRLPLHQDEFDVVLHDGVGLIRLPEEPTAVSFSLVCRICDLVPDDRGQVREPDLPAVLLDGGVKRNDSVLPGVLASREADVPDDNDKATARDEGSVACAPNLVQLVEELVIIFHVTKLPVGMAVLFESPVGRRRYNQVDALRGEEFHLPSVRISNPVFGRNSADRLLNQGDQSRVLGNAGDLRLRVRKVPKRRRQKGFMGDDALDLCVL